MKILVTGASGFVGPYLMRELESHGHEVKGLDRQGVTGFKADLCDQAAVLGVMEEYRPDAIAHLAGWSHVGASWQNPVEVFQQNVSNSIILYEAFRRVVGVKGLFLLVSSSSVYGAATLGDMPLDEWSPLFPESPYSVSKISAEHILQSLEQSGGPRLLIARPFNHIGRGQAPTFACPNFAFQVAEIEAGRRRTMIHGNLESRRDFIDVRDTVRAYRLILEQAEANPRLYVIATGMARSMRSIVEELFSLAGIEPAMELDRRLLRPKDTPELRGNPKRLMKFTGWEPTHDIRETLQLILEEARERLQAGPV